MKEHLNCQDATLTKPKKSVLASLILPTLLTITIGSIEAQQLKVAKIPWTPVDTMRVELDGKKWHPYDNQDGSVARLGVSPYYFVQYYSADKKSHTKILANVKGTAIVDPRLPTLDLSKNSVRYVVFFKDNTKVSFDERKSPVFEGNGLPGKTGKFRFLSVPREGVQKNFHPAGVERVELQLRPIG